MRQNCPLITAVTALLFAAPGAAQMRSGVELGAKAGITFSTLSVEDDEGTDIGTRTSFGGGGFFRIPLGQIAIQPELLYLGKGAEISGDDLDGSVTLKLDYVEIPLLLVVPFNTAGGVSPYVFGGPSIAFEAGCNLAIDAAGLDLELDCDEGEGVDFEVERKKTDFGAVVGAGLQLPAGPGAFLLEGRYTFGLNDINDSEEDNSIKNRSGAVMIGYSIPLSR